MDPKSDNQKPSDKIDHASVDAIYEDEYWHHVNTGEETIHAKRMPGRFRNLKWLAAMVWLSFFIGPYLRWDGQQAVLFDIVNRKFHIFNVTILPQDVWLLAMVMTFFAMLLAAVTSVAGRVFCGYFCFQTIWTDIFTWLEEKLEGPPAKRVKLDKAPWNARKIRIKLIKHIIWVLIGVLTGVTFTLWFGDAFEVWASYFTFEAPLVAWITVATFTAFTYVFAGFMREQVCLWLCPYARIQGVMYDCETILPTYDFKRGEPRGKIKKNQSAHEAKRLGDCIDCKQCVAVCPTGVDIRQGQQEGCITCGLCIDACDSIMDKVDRPRGLIRYASLDEIDGKPELKLFQRPRVLVYLTIIVLSIAGLLWGLFNLGALELSVIHERQPLYVIQSDGSVQNKYEIKILNKTDEVMSLNVAAQGHEKLTIHGLKTPVDVEPGDVGAYTLFLRIPGRELKQERAEIVFTVTNVDDESMDATYNSMFFGPRQ